MGQSSRVCSLRQSLNRGDSPLGKIAPWDEPKVWQNYGRTSGIGIKRTGQNDAIILQLQRRAYYFGNQLSPAVEFAAQCKSMFLFAFFKILTAG